MTGESDAGRDLLAAEYALGTLDAPERDTAERMRASEPAFDAAVRWWEERLAPLTAGVAPVAPSPSVWPRLVATLDAPRAITQLSDNVSRAAAHGDALARRDLATGALAAALALFVMDRDVLRGPRQTDGAYVAAVNRAATCLR